ncbi:MAG TPA: hypothetical protein VGM77_06190 [Gemmatimonadales bacterium]|jgi:hypothetical protein
MRVRFVHVVPVLAFIGACAADPAVQVAEGKTYPYLVQLDHSPTAADSLATIQLGVTSVRPIRSANALVVVAADAIKPFSDLRGYQYFFQLTDTAQVGHASIIFASPATVAEKQLLLQINHTASPIEYNADSTTASVQPIFESLNMLTGDKNVLSVSIDPYVYYPF